MSILISRQAAVDAMLQLQKEDDDMYGVHIPEGFNGQRAVEALMKLPPVERKKGKWIGTDTKFGIRLYHCSECQAGLLQLSLTNFCPNCGAEMVGEDINVPTREDGEA